MNCIIWTSNTKINPEEAHKDTAPLHWKHYIVVAYKHGTMFLEVTDWWKVRDINLLFLIGICSMQGKTATMKHEVTWKTNKKIKAYNKSV